MSPIIHAKKTSKQKPVIHNHLPLGTFLMINNTHITSPKVQAQVRKFNIMKHFTFQLIRKFTPSYEIIPITYRKLSFVLHLSNRYTNEEQHKTELCSVHILTIHCPPMKSNATLICHHIQFHDRPQSCLVFQLFWLRWEGHSKIHQAVTRDGRKR